jgi:hypothetical protein
METQVIVLEELANRVKMQIREETLGAPIASKAANVSLGSDLSWQLKAVQLFAQTGNLAQVARELEMTIYELQKLTRTQWWMDECALLRREEMALTNVCLTRLLDKTLEALEDRLDNGDKVMTAFGVQAIPLDAKTLIRLADVVFDKRQLIRNLPTVIDGDASKLASLAEKLSRLGQARREGITNVIELMPSQPKAGGNPQMAETLDG